MADRLRVFVALSLAESECEPLAAWARTALGGVEGLRPVPAANLHITLVFCGWLGHDQAARVVAITREEAASERAVALAPERIAVLGSVVALLLRPAERGGGERLAALQSRLDDRLVGEGLAERELRPWRPHVTLARARGRGRGPRPRPGNVEPPGGVLGPSGVAAYTTVPVAGGVTYRPLVHIGFDDEREGRAPASVPRGG